MNGRSLKPPRLNRCGSITGLVVYIVDGEYVRNKQDIDFVCGGNEAVYPNYVPKGEIWIDNALTALDRTATLLHEIVERNLMVNKGWTYDKAHDAASAAERPFRKALLANRPRSIDLPRVNAELAKVARAAADPTQKRDRIRAGLKAATAKAKVKPAPHDREYPRVAAVGRRRTAARMEREIDASLNRAGQPGIFNRGPRGPL